MKRSNLLLLIIGVAIIFFSCEKMDPLVPDLSSDQATTSLKAAKVKTSFSGVCSSTEILDEQGLYKELPNDKIMNRFITVWHDVADDPAHWMVTGQTTWYVNQMIEEDGSFRYWGKAELIVDGVNEGDPSRGHWEMTWRGYLTFTPEGAPQLIADAVGQGKSGEVKGLVAKWTYTMDFFADPGPVYNFIGVYH